MNDTRDIGGASLESENVYRRSASELPVTIYRSESPLEDPAGFFRSMVRDLLASPELAWRFFVRDLRAQYRESLLGYAWIFIPPLLTAIPFIFLNSQGIINISETSLPYAAYAIIGTMIWQVFVDSLNSPLTAVNNARYMLTRIKIPQESILLSGLMKVLFNFFIRLILLCFVFVWFGIFPPFTAILFPLGIFSLILTGFVIGLLLTPIGVLYGDVHRIVAVAIPFLMLLTPVLYPPPKSGAAEVLATLNPLTPLVTNTRDWLTLGTVGDPSSFIAVTTLMSLLLIVSWVIYRVALPHLVARLGN